MGAWKRLIQRLGYGRHADADLDREIRSHLDLETEEQRESGLGENDARVAASRAFGNATRVKEDTRAAWGWMWLQHLRQDFCFGLRHTRFNLGVIVMGGF